MGKIEKSPRRHPHAEAMAKYAQDAATDCIPWRRWEYSQDGGVTWEECGFNPCWYYGEEYRRKSEPIPKPEVRYPNWRSLNFKELQGFHKWLLEQDTPKSRKTVEEVRRLLIFLEREEDEKRLYEDYRDSL